MRLWGSALAFVVVPSSALAQTSTSAPPAAAESIDRPAEHRSGAVFGAALGVGTFDVSGYPNSASRLGDSAYYHSSGPLVGFGHRFFLMGALADTFNFGVWYGGISGQSSTTKASAQGGGLRIEAFPLYSFSPKLRDLGFVAQFGVGTAVADKKDGSLSVDGTQSIFGLGALYELSRSRFIGLKATTGIVVEYQYVTSQSIDSHGALLGARVAFYGGP